MATVERRHRATAVLAMFPGSDGSPLWMHFVVDGEVDYSPTCARVAQALADAESRATEGQGFDPWEALILWATHYGHKLREAEVSNGKVRLWADWFEFAPDVARRPSGGMGMGSVFFVEADTARAAALDLCRKLGLLPKGPNNG